MSRLHSSMTLMFIILVTGTVACEWAFAARYFSDAQDTTESALDTGNRRDVDTTPLYLSKRPDKKPFLAGLRNRALELIRLRTNQHTGEMDRTSLPGELWSAVQSMVPPRNRTPGQTWHQNRNAPQTAASPVAPSSQTDLLKKMLGSRHNNADDPARQNEVDKLIANVLRYCRSHYRPGEACPQLAALSHFGLPLGVASSRGPPRRGEQLFL
ncbi:conserved hypothetical protein [Neospora caninum Liverpool]|uniref:Transmembrane protein n=1 Tax=Neospora caninum (strain Liverpool) TaxID=572307 RepID=F0V8W8_NEOCL|nr:conserved hypothetical protein [Neospora caninum Liverpool]CBZ50159.1 conserved hypothetical protein [Neospora caninum Liverpool]CEL64754.1 TPA: hypothetical protein BN1204_006350 [Neospora caninum Liverpool]|eukprot:XP_003880194.1 conserved hypothetical protein [Neospora caninum Liverpool]